MHPTPSTIAAAFEAVGRQVPLADRADEREIMRQCAELIEAKRLGLVQVRSGTFGAAYVGFREAALAQPQTQAA